MDHNETFDSAYCPECEQVTSARVVYGYPMQEDFPAHFIYGGDGCPEDAPTHYCDHCNVAWRVADSEPLYCDFPSKCYFCADLLRSTDKLNYSVEFEERMGAGNDGILLSDGAFTQGLYPVCSACREGIHENLEDMAAEEADEDRQRVAAYRVALGGVVIVVLLIVYAIFAAP